MQRTVRPAVGDRVRSTRPARSRELPGGAKAADEASLVNPSSPSHRSRLVAAKPRLPVAPQQAEPELPKTQRRAPVCCILRVPSCPALPVCSAAQWQAAAALRLPDVPHRTPPLAIPCRLTHAVPLPPSRRLTLAKSPTSTAAVDASCTPACPWHSSQHSSTHRQHSLRLHSSSPRPGQALRHAAQCLTCVSAELAQPSAGDRSACAGPLSSRSPGIWLLVKRQTLRIVGPRHGLAASAATRRAAPSAAPL